jgi:hypothetical protein
MTLESDVRRQPYVPGVTGPVGVVGVHLVLGPQFELVVHLLPLVGSGVVGVVGSAGSVFMALIRAAISGLETTTLPSAATTMSSSEIPLITSRSEAAI